MQLKNIIERECLAEMMIELGNQLKQECRKERQREPSKYVAKKINLQKQITQITAKRRARIKINP